MNQNNELRKDGRTADALRAFSLELDFAAGAPASVLVSMGRTRVICAVNIEERVPRWMAQEKVPGGWLSATYSMLPYATRDRNEREATRGKQSGRTQEIQRLIGRSLRAAIDLEALGSRTLWVDCDVIEADGGTRTASITGGWAALRLAVNRMLADGRLNCDPLRAPLAAVSAGLVDGRALLDLCYDEDLRAEVDLNCVMTADGHFIEVQGTAEGAPFTPEQLAEMLSLCRSGISELTRQSSEGLTDC